MLSGTAKPGLTFSLPPTKENIGQQTINTKAKRLSRVLRLIKKYIIITCVESVLSVSVIVKYRHKIPV